MPEPDSTTTTARPATSQPPTPSARPHTFRKTVATLIDKGATADHAAAELGRGSKEITKKHYVVKPALAPDSSGILEQLGASRAELYNPPDDGPRRAA